MGEKNHEIRLKLNEEDYIWAEEAANNLGVSKTDFMTLLLKSSRQTGEMTLRMRIPSATTRAAFKEIEANKSPSFDSIESLLADLNADD